MRAVGLLVACVAASGCSLIVPGPGDYEFGPAEDGGGLGDDAGDTDAGVMDGGDVDEDAGEPVGDAGPDAESELLGSQLPRARPLIR